MFVLIVLLSFIFLSFISSYAEIIDSVPTVDLKEFVVEGERLHIESDKIVYIPTKKEKNLSNSPESLLEQLHSPLFRKDGDMMRDINGNELKYFINGKEASAIDIENFWTRDVISIEYMPVSTDPKYRGARGVINFVVAEYEYGGVTKVSGNQEFVERGYYSASSKLVFKKMTYGVLFNGGYLSKKGDEISEEQYRDLWYNGNKYEEISSSGVREMCPQHHKVNAAFSATYRSGGTYISHYAGLAWENSPENAEKYILEWHPDIFNSTSRLYTISKSTLSPQLSGSYSFTLNDRNSIYASWAYTYARQDRHSTSTEIKNNIFANSNKENMHSGRISVSPTYMFSPRAYLQINLNTTLSWYDIRYSGTYESTDSRFENYTTFAVSGFWQPSDKIYFTIMPGLSVDYADSNGRKIRSSVQPNGYVDVTWTPSSKFNLYCSGSYFINPPLTSKSNDALVRESELMWRSGNIDMPCLNFTRALATATWRPVSWFSGAFNINYTRFGNDVVTTYKAAPREMGGLISTYTSVKSYDDFRVNVNLSFPLLKNSLILYGRPVWKYVGYSGFYAARGLHTFSYSLGASYRVGNFGFNLSYNSSDKSIRNGGQSVIKTRDNLGLSATYGSGNLFILLGIDNITHAKEKGFETFESPHYCWTNNSSYTGRMVYLTVSYTFGYGKKIDRSINISTPDVPKSGAL